VPSLLALPSGCPFHPRCPLAEAVCRQEGPELQGVLEHHQVACWMVENA
jgi:peptide/nickel transport system ATP-binding protein